MLIDAIAPDKWLAAEDSACFAQRVKRLHWLASIARSASVWTFPGGWLAKNLFEEARYSFVYGQFLAAALLGFAFLERTLAAMFYASGRNDLERAPAERLITEALSAGWITADESAALDKARRLRNPLVHFRRPGHVEGYEFRSVEADVEPYAIVESDAKHILEALFRVVAKNAAA